MAANLCEFAIGTDPWGLAVACGAPAAPGRFAYCAEHRAGLLIRPRAAYLDRREPATVTQDDDDE